ERVRRVARLRPEQLEVQEPGEIVDETGTLTEVALQLGPVLGGHREMGDEHEHRSFQGLWSRVHANHPVPDKPRAAMSSAADTSPSTVAPDSTDARAESADLASAEPTLPSAQAACARTSASSSESAAARTATASLDAQLPSATATLRLRPV